MNLFRIAFRNLGRSPARTALSIVAVAASVMAVLLIKGMIDGILDTMEDSTIRLSSGHVRLIDREYEARERLLSLQYPVDGFEGEGYERIAEELLRLEGVAHVVPRIRFGGMVSHGEDVRSVLVVGGEPAVEHDLLRVDRYLTRGRYVQPGAREAVLGRRLLERLDMDVGDRFTLVFSSSFGALRGYSFTVVGALDSSLPYLDDGTVFIPLDVAMRAVDLEDAVTELLVMAQDKNDVPSIYQQVETLLEEQDNEERYIAIPWYQHNDLIASIQYGRRIYDGIYIGLLFLASFVVINTFVMIVNERRREIGLLAALGLRPNQIRGLFILEGALCGLAGSLLGALLGSMLVALLTTTGIAMPGIETMDAQVMYPAVLYPVFNAEVVLYAFFGGIVVTVLAVSFPARQAARMQPIDALKP